MTIKHFDWTINQHINWHIVAGHGTIPEDTPVGLFDTGAGLEFVDCEDECRYCVKCLGCLRKIAASIFADANREIEGVDLEREPWRLEQAKMCIEYMLGCDESPDGAHHI